MSATTLLESFDSAQALCERALNYDYFHKLGDEEEPVIPAHFVAGQGPLVVVVGDNASGKSFFRKLIRGICVRLKSEHETYVECMAISMQGRAGPDMTGGMRAFIYGDESYNATGVNSARTITTGIKTCRAREHRHIVIWDEPDLGLSEGAAAGAGMALAAYGKDPNPLTVAAIVITHSRALVRELLPLSPHYLHLGSMAAPATLQAWLDQPIQPCSLEDLEERGMRRFRAIQAILDNHKSR